VTATVGSATVETDTSSAGNQLLKLVDGDSSSSAGVRAAKSFAVQNGAVAASVRVKAEQTNAGFFVNIGSASITDAVVVAFGSDGKIKYRKASAPTGYITLQSYTPGQWYKVEVLADAAANTADVYIDGVRLAAQEPFYRSTGSLSLATLSATSGAGTFYADELHIIRGFSTSAGLHGIAVNGYPVSGFGTDILHYELVLPAGTAAAEQIGAATVTGRTYAAIAPLQLPGTVRVIGIAEDRLTLREYTVSLQLGQPKVYLINESFEEANPLSGFTVSNSPLYGTASIVQQTGTSNRYLQLVDVNSVSWNGVTVSKSVYSTGVPLTVEANVWAEVSGTGFILDAANGGSRIAAVGFGGDGLFKFWRGNSTAAGTVVNVPSSAAISTGRWYTLKLVIDPAGQTYDVYIDGAKKVSQEPLANGYSSNLTIRLQTISGTGTFRADDLRVLE
jgi:hypothetical protein